MKGLFSQMFQILYYHSIVLLHYRINCKPQPLMLSTWFPSPCWGAGSWRISLGALSLWMTACARHLCRFGSNALTKMRRASLGPKHVAVEARFYLHGDNLLGANLDGNLVLASKRVPLANHLHVGVPALNGSL